VDEKHVKGRDTPGFEEKSAKAPEIKKPVFKKEQGKMKKGDLFALLS